MRTTQERHGDITVDENIVGKELPKIRVTKLPGLEQMYPCSSYEIRSVLMKPLFLYCIRLNIDSGNDLVLSGNKPVFKLKLTPIYVAIPRHELGYIELRMNMLTRQAFHQLIVMVNLDTVVYEIGDTPLYHPDLLCNSDIDATQNGLDIWGHMQRLGATDIHVVIEIGTWVTDYTRSILWCVIIHPCRNFNSVFSKL